MGSEAGLFASRQGRCIIKEQRGGAIYASTKPWFGQQAAPADGWRRALSRSSVRRHQMPGFHCSTCGSHHDELPLVLGAFAPAAWEALPENQREARAVLSSDQCIIDNQQFFLLGRLDIPVVGQENPFTWLTWVSVSEANFERASDLWHTEGRESEPPYFAWIQSALPYPGGTLSLKAKLITQPLGERPLVVLEETDHPLAVEQREGITAARLQSIVEAALHGV
ncbi:MAG TPA: DUF2199 domain-containing protein [Thermoanaerobaculia bacterium]|nr:DUF2199 domain-containing protein [Thermoanaerobaculia bacterium]